MRLSCLSVSHLPGDRMAQGGWEQMGMREWVAGIGREGGGERRQRVGRTGRGLKA